MLDFGRTTFGASCTGAAKTCLRLAVKHAKSRVQFKQPLAEFELVKKKIAFMAAHAFAFEATTTQCAAFIDSGSDDYMLETAMLKVWSGKAGGPIADLAKLIGEVLAVERVPIRFDVEGVKGSLRIGQAIEADLEPFIGATGKPTTLHDSIFTTIPGSPAFVGKASKYKVNVPQHGFKIDLSGHNAVQGSFRFEA